MDKIMYLFPSIVVDPEGPTGGDFLTVNQEKVLIMNTASDIYGGLNEYLVHESEKEEEESDSMDDDDGIPLELESEMKKLLGISLKRHDLVEHVNIILAAYHKMADELRDMTKYQPEERKAEKRKAENVLFSEPANKKN